MLSIQEDLKERAITKLKYERLHRCLFFLRKHEHSCFEFYFLKRGQSTNFLSRQKMHRQPLIRGKMSIETPEKTLGNTVGWKSRSTVSL